MEYPITKKEKKQEETSLIKISRPVEKLRKFTFFSVGSLWLSLKLQT